MLNQRAEFDANAHELYERVQEFVACGRLDYYADAWSRGLDPYVRPEYGPNVEPLYRQALAAVGTLGYRVFVFDGRCPHPRASERSEGLCSYQQHIIYIKRQTPTTMTKVLLHELTHALSESDVVTLSYEYDNTQLIRYTEQMAESAAALVMLQYGFDVFDDVIPYLATWGLHQSDYRVLGLLSLAADELNQLLARSHVAVAA